MKDFITTIASVLVLMMFLMQFTANQITFTKIMGAEHEIRQLRLISENQGMIKSEDIAELKESLAEILGCGQSEIAVAVSGAAPDQVNSSGAPVSSGLEVSMPVYGVIGPARALGLAPSENVRTHISRSLMIFMPQEEQEPEEPVQ
ncbi:MAG: hypothetical protein IKM19_05090 [Firmicutes bacterium]|nr:hypothetical protein [Bacillota bacterium]MBR6584054.1 hypothetical protein [Bacillota bacterium]